MKISKHQLRRIVRKVIVESYVEKGYGWHDFKMMASEGNYDGCFFWLEDHLRQRGDDIVIDPEEVYALIEYASDETVTEAELEKEFNAIIGVKE